MSTPINYLVLSYPNFALGQTIDPDEVNQNNTDITNKLNEFVDDVNLSLANSETAVADSATAVNTTASIQTDYNTLKPLLEKARDDANYASTYIDDKVLASNQSIYRQALINGNFDVWQRGTSFDNVNFVYTADRWKILSDTDSYLKVSQSADVPIINSICSSRYSIRMEEYMSTGSVSAFSDLVQYIEDFALFAGQTVTFSGYYKCDSGVSGQAYLRWNDTTGYSNILSLSSTVWSKFSVTVVIPQGSSTMLRANLRILRSGLVAGKGMNFSQIQINVGSVALPFMPKSFAQELQDCMRYYEKSYEQGILPSTSTTLGIACVTSPSSVLGNLARIGGASFKTPKRGSPIVSLYSVNGFINKVSDVNGTDFPANSGTAIDASQTGFNVQNQSGGNLNLATPYYILYHWTADAEL